MSNNGPYVLVPLSKEEFEFLRHNCNTNIAQGLSFLPMVSSRASAEKLVGMIENFKAIGARLKTAEAEAVPHEGDHTKKITRL